MAERIEEIYKSIFPKGKEGVHSILKRLGHDLRDWSNMKGGASKAPANPKYCYNWSFENPGKAIALCLWHAEIKYDDSSIFQANNLRGNPAGQSVVSKSIWKRRAQAVDRDVRSAYLHRLPIDVILLSGSRRDKSDPNARASRVGRRQLDAVKWAVTEYDFESGDYVLTRGVEPIIPFGQALDFEVQSFKEGAPRRAFRNHRFRERRARQAKLREAKSRNAGRLVCEVPNCGFDFAEHYGPKGEGYAQVHHLEPLSDAPREGRVVTLDKLAIVCANCHVMIHVGGQCRRMTDLIVVDP